MKFKKFWDNVPETSRNCIYLFTPWAKANLTITHGRDKTTELTYGFPYTSTSEFALIGNTNCEAIYNSNPEFRFEYLAVTETDDVVVGLCRDTENGEEYAYIPIGKITPEVSEKALIADAIDKAKSGFEIYCTRNQQAKILSAMVDACYKHQLSWKQYDAAIFEIEELDLSKYRLSEKAQNYANRRFTEETVDSKGNYMLSTHILTDGWYQFIRQLGYTDFRDAAYQAIAWSDEQWYIFSFCEGDIYLTLFEKEDAYKKAKAELIHWWEEER